MDGQRGCCAFTDLYPTGAQYRTASADRDKMLDWVPPLAWPSQLFSAPTFRDCSITRPRGTAEASSSWQARQAVVFIGDACKRQSKRRSRAAFEAAHWGDHPPNIATSCDDLRRARRSLRRRFSLACGLASRMERVRAP